MNERFSCVMFFMCPFSAADRKDSSLTDQLWTAAASAKNLHNIAVSNGWEGNSYHHKVLKNIFSLVSYKFKCYVCFWTLCILTPKSCQRSIIASCFHNGEPDAHGKDVPRALSPWVIPSNWYSESDCFQLWRKKHSHHGK